MEQIVEQIAGQTEHTHHLNVKAGSSLIPRLSRNANCSRVESLVSFLHKHDVIEIGLKQKGNICALFNQLCVQCSVCMIFDPR